MVPGIETTALERLFSEVLDRAIRLSDAEALGESSRAAPWRIDIDTADGSEAYLLRVGDACSRNEVVALRAMSEHSIPTPRVLHWDETGIALGTPVFISEHIEGNSLLPAMRDGATWAVDLFIDTACALQAIRAEDLREGAAAQLDKGDSIREVVDKAYSRLPNADALHKTVYRCLIDNQPSVPETAFSNGDLWPDNLLVRGRSLVGVIDWQHAGWSDPIFEFLLPFFLVPELRGRGIETRYCERQGYDPAVLGWYRGVELFDSLAWVLKTGEPYEMHTAESLRTDLERWLAGQRARSSSGRARPTEAVPSDRVPD